MSLARARHLAAVVVLSMLAVLLGVLVTGAPSQAAETPVLVPSDGETVPGTHTGDTIDDPAIWVNSASPEQSLIIANDKAGALETYNLDGSLEQRIATDGSSWGNVDVRQDVTIGGFTGSLVAAQHQGGVRFYGVDRSARRLVPINDSVLAPGLGEGLCLYQSPTSHKVYGFGITIQGALTQYEILDSDNNGLLETHTVRSFAVGSEAEGCVADDDTGALYVSEEDHALWRYSAEPGGGTTREAVDVLTADGGHLVSDIEGVTLVDQDNGDGYIIVSAQNVADPNNSYFSVYRRGAGNDFVSTFRVSNGTASDDCDRTDGVTATTADLGPAFPRGMFICQDNNNDLPGGSGNQDVKMVRLEKVVDLDGGGPPPPPPPPPPSSISFVGRSTVDSNSTSWTVPVPANTQAGDQMLLFASHGNTVTPGGPGAGWTPVGTKVVDNSLATSVWRRTAVAGDVGTSVKLTNGSVTKLSLTLASYRGVDPSSPVIAVNGVGEPGTTASHSTPLVANSTTGAWRVSFWTDKNAATTRWTAPAGETVRATTVGTGSGRIDTLLTDPAVAQTAGAPADTGRLTATADATATAATMWTLLLKPATDGPPVDQPPVARFDFTCSGLVCDFDGSDSSDAEDSIASYAWDFDDDGSGDQVTEHHEFGATGTYDVTLTVTDDNGATDSVTRAVTVGSPPPPSAISFVGLTSSNVNSTSVTVKVPATVQPGDALLLFAAQGKAQAITGPGAGWTQVGRVVDGDAATTVWRRVAAAGDAGNTIKLTTPAISKIALTVAAYRGTSASDPVLAISGAAEPGTSTSHLTPTVANDTSGAWRVSYWTDKNASTTTWTPPAGETVRGTVYGTGSGRVDALLTDPDAALTAGSPATTGGLTATADGRADKATSWTILLRPGA